MTTLRSGIAVGTALVLSAAGFTSLIVDRTSDRLVAGFDRALTAPRVADTSIGTNDLWDHKALRLSRFDDAAGFSLARRLASGDQITINRAGGTRETLDVVDVADVPVDVKTGEHGAHVSVVTARIKTEQGVRQVRFMIESERRVEPPAVTPMLGLPAKAL